MSEGADQRTSGEIIFVDDYPFFRDFYTDDAKQAGVDFTVFEGAEGALARLEESKAVAAVFTDGLDGAWKEVVDAAKKDGIPAFVVSTDDNIQTAVEAEGAQFILKNMLRPGFLALRLAGLERPAETNLP